MIMDEFHLGTEKGGLPDVTASTGFSFAPAKQLKSGSVMDFLGKIQLFTGQTAEIRQRHGLPR